jgi:hypothetical protein
VFVCLAHSSSLRACVCVGVFVRVLAFFSPLLGVKKFVPHCCISY